VTAEAVLCSKLFSINCTEEVIQSYLENKYPLLLNLILMVKHEHYLENKKLINLLFCSKKPTCFHF